MDKFQNWEGALKGLGHTISVKKGEIIVSAGDEAYNFFFVKEGEVRLYKLDSNGQEIQLRVVTPNNIFGEVMAFAETTYPVFAQALKECKIIKYNTSEVLKATQKNNELAQFFIKTLAKRCLFLNKAISNVGGQELPVRLARYILDIAKQHEVINNKVKLELSTPKKDIASTLGTIPETLSRTLKKLQSKEFIKVSGKTIIISDYQGLKDFAQ